MGLQLYDKGYEPSTSLRQRAYLLDLNQDIFTITKQSADFVHLKCFIAFSSILVKVSYQSEKQNLLILFLIIFMFICRNFRLSYKAKYGRLNRVQWSFTDSKIGDEVDISWIICTPIQSHGAETNRT